MYPSMKANFDHVSLNKTLTKKRNQKKRDKYNINRYFHTFLPYPSALETFGQEDT